MAAQGERERGCGWRKIGGIYLVGDGPAEPCGLLPRELTTCPCCGAGVKQKIGWSWAAASLIGRPEDVKGCEQCWAADSRGPAWPCMMPQLAVEHSQRVGLIWVGAQHYKTAADFCAEAREMGISRRVHAVPKGLEPGKTRVLLAHPAACPCPDCGSAGVGGVGDFIGDGEDEVHTLHRCARCKGKGRLPGVFGLFRPTRVEQIVTDSQACDADFMAGLEKRGISPVAVPDGDPDHAPRRSPENGGER
jgi:hypothetical protein